MKKENEYGNENQVPCSRRLCYLHDLCISVPNAGNQHHRRCQRQKYGCEKLQKILLDHGGNLSDPTKMFTVTGKQYSAELAKTRLNGGESKYIEALAEKKKSGVK